MMDISSDERGVLRLFSIKLDAEDIPAFQRESYSEDGDLTDWPLQAALGAASLDHDFIEVFPVSDLAGLGLPGYLMTGNGIPEDQVEPMRAQLEAIKGHILLVHSGAFNGRAQSLEISNPLVHIGTFFEEDTTVKFEPLPDESAKPEAQTPPPPKRPSDAAIGGRVALVALLVAFGVAALMVWIGG